MENIKGIVDIVIGGCKRRFRFRAYEVYLLDKALGVPVLNVLQSQEIGMEFLLKALLVGLDHSAAVRARKKEPISEKIVAGWIDKHGNFPQLLETVIGAIMDGLPIEKDEDADDEEELDEGKEDFLEPESQDL